MLPIITVIAASYLTGSIPTAFLFAKYLKGIDIRKAGSGNVGATNAMRILGKKAGISVLLIDIIKGFLPVFFFGPLITNGLSPEAKDALYILIGLSCISGHNWTIFLNFKGGKGVATSLGVLLALSFKIQGLYLALSAGVVIWLISFLLSRTVSIASLTSALFFPFLTLIFCGSVSMRIASAIFSIMLILRHRTNILRILRGEESKLNFRKTKK